MELLEGDTSDKQGGPREDGEAHLELDDAFDILSNERRRRVLTYLLRTDAENVEIGELAEHIAARENDTSVAGLTSDERKRVYVGLYQNHLPRMDDADIIEFDSDRKTIELGEHGRPLETYLEVDPHGRSTAEGPPWVTYNLLVAGCGVLAVFVSALGNNVLAANQLAVLGSIILASGLLSGGQFYYHRK